MISYKITSKNTTTNIHPKSRKAISPADPDYKERLMERILHKFPYHKGERVRVVGTSECGTIKHIEFDINKIRWINDSPHFITVVADDGNEFLLRISEVTRKRVKT